MNCVDVRRASVVITLDRTGPEVTVEVEGPAAPPEPLHVIVSSSEGIGASSYHFEDASEDLFYMVSVADGPNRDAVVLDTTNLAPGLGSLLIQVSDPYGNVTRRQVPVYVDRPGGPNMEMGTCSVFVMVTSMEKNMDTDMGTSAVHKLTQRIYTSAVPTTDSTGSTLMTMEVTDDQD